MVIYKDKGVQLNLDNTFRVYLSVGSSVPAIVGTHQSYLFYKGWTIVVTLSSIIARNGTHMYCMTGQLPYGDIPGNLVRDLFIFKQYLKEYATK